MWVYDAFPLKFVFSACTNKLQGFFFFTFFFICFFFLNHGFLLLPQVRWNWLCGRFGHLIRPSELSLDLVFKKKKVHASPCMWCTGCHVIALVISQIPIRFMVQYQYQFICIHLTRSRSKKVNVGLGKGWLKFCIYANLRVNSFLIANGKMEKSAVRKTG